MPYEDEEMTDEEWDRKKQEAWDETKFHCRICGTRYDSKQEAKECQRNHEWHNRRGRK